MESIHTRQAKRRSFRQGDVRLNQANQSNRDTLQVVTYRATTIENPRDLWQDSTR